MSLRTIIVAFSLTTATVARSQVVALISDWQHHEINQETYESMRSHLNTTTAALWQVQNINGAFPNKASLSLNARANLDNWFKPKDLDLSALNEVQLSIPTWCTIGNRDVWIMQTIDPATGVILKASHSSGVRPTAPYSTAQKKIYADHLSKGLTTLFSRHQQATMSISDKATSLRGRVALRKNNTVIKQGSGACISLLLEEELSKEQGGIWVQSNGTEQTELLRQSLLQQGSPLLRAQRILNIEWQPLASTPQSIPAKTNLSWTWSEGILGTRADTLQNAALDVALSPQDEISLTLPESLLKFFRSRIAQRQNPPSVQKIDRRWVYVDQGRSYGLRIDDRLVSSDGRVAGHVVGYFGAQLNLRDKNGTPIDEGAIIFIRRGEGSVQQGMTLSYDQTKYPTPWPP